MADEIKSRSEKIREASQGVSASQLTGIDANQLKALADPSFSPRGDIVDPGRSKYIDAPDAQASAGQEIQFLHIASGDSVDFKAFITGFTDNYTSNWNQESVYGRMDPIATFVGTQRTVSLQWQTVAATTDEGIQNLRRCQLLARMLYPVYNSRGVLQSPPLFKLKVMNWIQNASSPGGDISTSGLVGFPGGFSFNPDLEVGVFEQPGGKIYPKVISISCDYTVIHTHELGYNKDGKPLKGNFPYGENLGNLGDSSSNPTVAVGSNARDADSVESVSDQRQEQIAQAREDAASACGVLQSCIDQPLTSGGTPQDQVGASFVPL